MKRVLIVLGVIAALIAIGIVIFILVRGRLSEPKKAADDYTVSLPGDVQLVMKKIPAGTFTMGSPEDELGRIEDETQHQVTLTNDFWLGRYEVTEAQYQAVMGMNPFYDKGDNFPVEYVSWINAMNFCQKLNEQYSGKLPEGYQFTLPTEAQWEYACRAGTTTALNSGKDLTSADGTCPNMDEVGWYNMNSGYNTHPLRNAIYSALRMSDKIADETLHPVGRKRPNAWGLYDMHGNVFEWCLDWYEEKYPTGTVEDPTGPASGSERVLRSGNSDEHGSAQFCRSAYRFSFPPTINIFTIGFRLALAKVQ